ncbi:hypothetical protein BE20_02530 [Sorangium cellulosum]|uniref:Uncharacterized protein n=1 Tax=Sorangium cellulosum TaxID=56 RepID=A0A150SWE0_SORCE|nr:hypothetical protein BE20_02530 [Sorangium cellulosum]KYF96815.1 hypothetical protein BE18_42000 [Sorangium cellulosum]
MVCVCLLASACGDDSTGGSPSGSTSSSASGGGQGGDGGSGGGGGSGGNGGSGGEVDCSAFEDDAPGTPVTITVTNHRATSIYYPGNECVERFRIGPDGGRLGTADYPWVYMTCEEVQTADDWPQDCFGGSTFEIAAGETATFSWSGLLYETQQMPIACAAQPDNPFADDCPRAVAVQPGAFKIALELFGAATCEDEGLCSLSEPFTVEQRFTYPDDTAVELSVD